MKSEVFGSHIEKIESTLEEAHKKMDICYMDFAFLKKYHDEREIYDIQKDIKAVILDLERLYVLLDKQRIFENRGEKRK